VGDRKERLARKNKSVSAFNFFLHLHSGRKKGFDHRRGKPAMLAWYQQQIKGYRVILETSRERRKGEAKKQKRQISKDHAGLLGRVFHGDIAGVYRGLKDAACSQTIGEKENIALNRKRRRRRNKKDLIATPEEKKKIAPKRPSQRLRRGEAKTQQENLPYGES